MLPEYYSFRLLNACEQCREIDKIRKELYLQYPNAFYSEHEKPVEYLKYPFEMPTCQQ